jgi:hypothetical protein
MKRDGRTLDHKTLEEIRRMAVQRVWDGERPSAVIASYGFGVSPTGCDPGQQSAHWRKESRCMIALMQNCWKFSAIQLSSASFFKAESVSYITD